MASAATYIIYIPVGSSKHNGVVERHISMTLELAMTSCLEAPRLFGDTKLPSTGPLSAEACKLNMTGEGLGQVGHELAVPEGPRQSAVFAAALFPEARLPPRQKDSDVGA